MIAECVKTYALAVDHNGEIVGEVTDGQSRERAGQELVRRARVYASDHNVDFATALHRVMDNPENEDLVRTYNSGGSA